MQGKRVSFFSFLPTFGQSSNIKEGVKELNTIAVVTKFSHKYYNIQIGDGIDSRWANVSKLCVIFVSILMIVLFLFRFRKE